MKLETQKPPSQVLTELFFKNLFWYFIFSLIYFDSNPLNWWMFQSVWGRLIIVILELGIITSTFNEKLENEKDSDG